MLHHVLLLLSICNIKLAAVGYQIEDIPIEHYVHEDIQQDEIDVELMPRLPRNFDTNANKAPDLLVEESQNVDDYVTVNDEECRNKKVKRERREVEATTLETNKDINSPLVDIVEIENATKETKETPSNVLINDFIKFKRSLESGEDQSEENRRINTGGKFIQSVPYQFNPIDTSRKTRGVVKDQWVKHPQVSHDDVYEDNIQLASETARAPRAPFITNRMNERDPLEYKFNREPRSEGTNKYMHTDLPAEYDYYQPRFARNFAPRSDRYDRYPPDRRNYYRNQDYPEKPLSYNPDYNEVARKRRVIYYATLPEAPRSYRSDEGRRPYDRSYFRDRYDYRYVEPEAYGGYRKRYPDSSRYDVNVSTGVKVREVPKKPERRIYSDVDRTAYSGN